MNLSLRFDPRDTQIHFVVSLLALCDQFTWHFFFFFCKTYVTSFSWH